MSVSVEKRMAELGIKAPEANARRHTIMGREFNPAQPEQYLKTFKITRL